MENSYHSNGTGEDKFEYSTVPQFWGCLCCSDAVDRKDTTEHQPICSNCLSAINDNKKLLEENGIFDSIRQIILVHRGRL